MPPPPAPPPPPGPSDLGPKQPAKPIARTALLSEIHQGARLKKTVTNDRSAPMVVSKTNNAGAKSTSPSPSMPKGDNAGVNKPSVGGLGALFANGVPRKPSEARNQQIGVKSVRALTAPVPPQSVPTPPSAAAKPSHSAMSTTIAALKNNNNNLVVNNNHPPSASPSPAPATPPKLKSTPASAPTLHSPIKSPSPPQQPTTPVLRPTQSSSNEPPSLRKQESRERMVPKQITRPGAPPPPIPTCPPVVPSAQFKPQMHVDHPPTTNVNFVTTMKIAASQPVRPAPPVPKGLPPQQSSAPSVPNQPTRSAPPPPPATTSVPRPPLRVSSQIDNNERRFHFIPVHELPTPDAFSGFRKEYQTGYMRQAASSGLSR